jgi:uncharacterized membrane protein HdeD (DUF308 family)
MKSTTLESTPVAPAQASRHWLRTYYLARAAVSILWVLAAVTLGTGSPLAAAILLIFYPAWDAAANLLDAVRNGGLARNPPQAINALISLTTTLAIAVALASGMNAVLGVFGVWAVVSGLLQLATAVRRWSHYGAQWVMILSGAQSALAGGFFIVRANTPGLHSIAELAPYVAFGAFYFLVSGLWLVFVKSRGAKA